MSIAGSIGLGWLGPIVRSSDVFYLNYKYGVCYTVGGVYALISLLSLVFLFLELLPRKSSADVCQLTLKHVGLGAIFFNGVIATIFWVFSGTVGSLAKTPALYVSLWVFPVAFFIISAIFLLHMYSTVFYEIQLSPKFDLQQRAILKKRRASYVQIVGASVLVYHIVVIILVVVPNTEFVQMILCAVSCVVGAAIFPIGALYLLAKKKRLMGNRTRSRRAKLRLIQLGSIGWLISVCLLLRGVSFLLWHFALSFERSLYWIYTACIQLALEAFPLSWLTLLLLVVKETDVEVTSYGEPDSGLYFTSQSESSLPTVNGQEFLLLPDSTST